MISTEPTLYQGDVLGKTVAVGTDITAFFASLKATSEED